MPIEKEVCPTCDREGDAEPKDIEKKEPHESYVIKEFSCGHKTKMLVREVHEYSPIKASPGEESGCTDLDPSKKQPNHEQFGKTVQGDSAAELYFGTTKGYRLAIAQMALEEMVKAYDNATVFGLYLTSFLVQAKAALDSLSQEINIRYSIHKSTKDPEWAMDAEELGVRYVKALRCANPGLADHWRTIMSSPWYKDLKDLRDAEGVHRHRSPRFLKIGAKPGLVIGIKGHEDIGPRCAEILKELDDAIEEAYGLML